MTFIIILLNLRHISKQLHNKTLRDCLDVYLLIGKLKMAMCFLQHLWLYARRPVRSRLAVPASAARSALLHERAMPLRLWHGVHDVHSGEWHITRWHLESNMWPDCTYCTQDYLSNAISCLSLTFFCKILVKYSYFARLSLLLLISWAAGALPPLLLDRIWKTIIV